MKLINKCKERDNMEKVELQIIQADGADLNLQSSDTTITVVSL